MTLEPSILETVRFWPADEQQALLGHAKQLQAESQPKLARTSIKELWADLNVSFSAADFDAVRHETGKNFPRDGVS